MAAWRPEACPDLQATLLPAGDRSYWDVTSFFVTFFL